MAVQFTLAMKVMKRMVLFATLNAKMASRVLVLIAGRSVQKVSKSKELTVANLILTAVESPIEPQVNQLKNGKRSISMDGSRSARKDTMLLAVVYAPQTALSSWMTLVSLAQGRATHAQQGLLWSALLTRRSKLPFATIHVRASMPNQSGLCAGAPVHWEHKNAEICCV